MLIEGPSSNTLQEICTYALLLVWMDSATDLVGWKLEGTTVAKVKLFLWRSVRDENKMNFF